MVEYALLKKERWDGLVDELRSIRNRLAHLRRPHRDDLLRVEQTLRNLERGTRIALEAYNDLAPYPNAKADPLSAAWVLEQHDDARRLIAHAERSYDTSFRLSYSVRPWATVSDPARLSGRAGILVHATWLMRDGSMLAPRAFWEDGALAYHDVRDLLVFVTHEHEGEVSVSFAATDDSKRVAVAIGTCFDAVLRHRDRAPSVTRRRRWMLDWEGLDWRVDVDTPLLVATPDQPFSVFGA